MTSALSRSASRVPRDEHLFDADLGANLEGVGRLSVEPKSMVEVGAAVVATGEVDGEGGGGLAQAKVSSNSFRICLGLKKNEFRKFRWKFALRRFFFFSAISNISSHP